MKHNYLIVEEQETFWVTNFSDRNVSLGDLYISIQAHSSVNLLDKARYSFTKEQLIKSAESGSIYLKKHLISVRKVPPQMIPKQLIEFDPNVVMPPRTKSGHVIEHTRYEELEEDFNDLIESNEKAGANK